MAVWSVCCCKLSFEFFKIWVFHSALDDEDRKVVKSRLKSKDRHYEGLRGKKLYLSSYGWCLRATARAALQLLLRCAPEI